MRSAPQNGLLPVVIAYADTYNKGASGQAVAGGDANGYFGGGYGNSLGQIFRRNFPNEYAGIHLADFPCTTAGRKPTTESSSCNCRPRSSPASATSIISA